MTRQQGGAWLPWGAEELGAADACAMLGHKHVIMQAAACSPGAAPLPTNAVRDDQRGAPPVAKARAVTHSLRAGQGRAARSGLWRVGRTGKLAGCTEPAHLQQQQAASGATASAAPSKQCNNN